MKEMPPLPVEFGVEFRHIENWPGYIVGDNGTVWSCRSNNKHKNGWRTHWRKLSPGIVLGYPQVILCCHGKQHQEKVHVLVLEAFVGPRPEGYECCHYDNNRANNHCSNLRWDTVSNNQKDSIRHGTCHGAKVRGQNHPGAKFTDEDIRQIRQLRKCGLQYNEIAELFDVNVYTIGKIIRREKWAHVA